MYRLCGCVLFSKVQVIIYTFDYSIISAGFINIFFYAQFTPSLLTSAGFMNYCRECGRQVKGPTCKESQCFAFNCNICNLSVRGQHPTLVASGSLSASHGTSGACQSRRPAVFFHACKGGGAEHEEKYVARVENNCRPARLRDMRAFIVIIMYTELV